VHIIRFLVLHCWQVQLRTPSPNALRLELYAMIAFAHTHQKKWQNNQPHDPQYAFKLNADSILGRKVGDGGGDDNADEELSWGSKPTSVP